MPSPQSVRNRAIALAVLNGSSYAHVGRQYGRGRQRILAIVQGACRPANPEAFTELAMTLPALQHA